MPGLQADTATRAWDSKAAQAGHALGGCGSAGIAASITAAAAWRHPSARSSGICSIVTACTSRCTDTHPAASGGPISEYRRSAAIASLAASGSSSSGTSSGATDCLSWAASPGRGCSSTRTGIASGAQNASSRSRLAAGGADCFSRSNASVQVVATVLSYPAGSPRHSISPRRCRNHAR